eukprot:3170658-Amphidinium_carterae.2
MEVFCDTESLDGSKAKGTVASTRTAMDATFEASWRVSETRGAAQEEADERVEQVEVLQCAPSTAPDEFGGSDCSSSGKEASAPLQAESEAVCDADEASAIPESMHSLGSEDVLRPNSEDAGEVTPSSMQRRNAPVATTFQRHPTVVPQIAKAMHLNNPRKGCATCVCTLI